MGAFRETERVADLCERAYGNARRRYAELGVVPCTQVGAEIDETAGDLGITVIERLSGSRSRRHNNQNSQKQTLACLFEIHQSGSTPLRIRAKSQYEGTQQAFGWVEQFSSHLNKCLSCNQIN